MKAIGKKVSLSAGGLYYHFSSVEEIFFEIVSEEKNSIWDIFKDTVDYETFLSNFDLYLKLEKKDLLNVENTINSMIYQYYFSLGKQSRNSEMKRDYKENMVSFRKILKKASFKNNSINIISVHVYTVLHGLTMAALTGELTEFDINMEFEEIKEYIQKIHSAEVN